jgi:hypothetical protein
MTKVAKRLYSEEELQKQFTEATQRATEADEIEPRAVRASYNKKAAQVVVTLATGVVVSIPSKLLQGLVDASPQDLSKVTVSPRGTALHWPMLDADFSVTGLMAGVFGTRAWMAELGRKGGQVTSHAKAMASRANGRKGGRPHKYAA